MAFFSAELSLQGPPGPRFVVTMWGCYAGHPLLLGFGAQRWCRWCQWHVAPVQFGAGAEGCGGGAILSGQLLSWRCDWDGKWVVSCCIPLSYTLVNGSYQFYDIPTHMIWIMWIYVYGLGWPFTKWVGHPSRTNGSKLLISPTNFGRVWAQLDVHLSPPDIDPREFSHLSSWVIRWVWTKHFIYIYMYIFINIHFLNLSICIYIYIYEMFGLSVD